MEFRTASEFISEHIQKRWNQKLARIPAEWSVLMKDTHIGGCEYAAGSKFKVFESENFGWIVFHSSTVTPDGHTPGTRIHKW